MTRTANTDDGTQAAAIDDRYGTFETATGDVVIYDEDGDDAWIQSDVAVGLD